MTVSYCNILPTWVKRGREPRDTSKDKAQGATTMMYRVHDEVQSASGVTSCHTPGRGTETPGDAQSGSRIREQGAKGDTPRGAKGQCRVACMTMRREGEARKAAAATLCYVQRRAEVGGGDVVSRPRMTWGRKIHVVAPRTPHSHTKAT